MADTRTVLVVDRDRDIIQGLAVRLGVAGYAVTTAAYPSAELQDCGAAAPDVILVGVSLPDLDGAAALRRCLEFAAPRNIPVISFSNSRRWRQRARTSGVRASLEEPFETEKLLEIIRLAVNESDVRFQASSAAPAGEAKCPEEKRAAPRVPDFRQSTGCPGTPRPNGQVTDSLHGSDSSLSLRPGQRRRILVVDDDAEIRAGARLRLAAAGFEVSCASDGEEALCLAAQWRPDLIVLDVRMPGMDGLTALGNLRRHAETSDIPVVMLSASVFDQRSALDAGARFFMKKPYCAPRLLATVHAAIAGGPPAAPPRSAGPESHAASRNSIPAEAMPGDRPATAHAR